MNRKEISCWPLSWRLRPRFYRIQVIRIPAHDPPTPGPGGATKLRESALKIPEKKTNTSFPFLPVAVYKHWYRDSQYVQRPPSRSPPTLDRDTVSEFYLGSDPGIPHTDKIYRGIPQFRTTRTGWHEELKSKEKMKNRKFP